MIPKEPTDEGVPAHTINTFERDKGRLALAALKQRWSSSSSSTARPPAR